MFVTNVPTSADEELLLEVFGKCGLVHDVHKFNPENLKRKAGRRRERRERRGDEPKVMINT